MSNTAGVVWCGVVWLSVGLVFVVVGRDGTGLDWTGLCVCATEKNNVSASETKVDSLGSSDTVE